MDDGPALDVPASVIVSPTSKGAVDLVPSRAHETSVKNENHSLDHRLSCFRRPIWTKSTNPKRGGPPTRMGMGVPAMRVRYRHPLHPGGQVGLAPRVDHEAPVIRRQAPGEQSWRVGPGQRFGQHAFKGEIIRVFEKQRQTHHTPIQDVIRKTRLRDACRPSHAQILPEPPARSRKSS